MKNKIRLLALMMGGVILQGCGGGSMLGTSDSDDYKLIPEEVIDDPTKPRPSESAAVIKTNGTLIEAPNGQAFLLRGANLPFADDPVGMINGIQAMSEAGSNVVRLRLHADTSATNIEAALNKVVENEMVAVLSLWDEGLECLDDEAAFADAINNVWMDEWLDVIAQDRYQANIMFNIASGWGPKAIFNGYSTGYKTYIDSYKTAIRQFRKAGFNVPLVIDAPGCGADYNAFVSGRAKELMAADEKENLILSVHGYGSTWKNGTKVIDAIELLTDQNIPVVMSEFGGSGVGDSPVKHMAILEKGAGNYGADIFIPWVGDTDKVGMTIPLSEPVDLTNTDVSFEVMLDEEYILDGNMGVVMYLRDVNENYANLAWHSAGEFTAGEWNSRKYSVKNNGSFGWASDEFDITAVAKVGVELVANGKSADVVGSVMIDTLKIIEGSGAVELYRQDFATDIAGWRVPWTGTTISHQDEALAIVRAADESEVVTQLDGLADSVDFSAPVQISAQIYLPSDYEGSWLYISIFNNDNGWLSVSAPTSGLVYGDWSELLVTAEFPGANSIGIQVGSIGVADGVSFTDSTAAILVDDFVVSGVEANDAFEMGVQYNGTFDDGEDGWAYLSWGAAATVVAENGSLNVTPNDTDALRIVVQKNDWAAVEFLDFESEPFTIKTRIQFPASYEGRNYEYKLFIQDKNWANHFEPMIWTQDDIVAGEWVDLSVDVEFPADFARDGSPQHFGFEINSDTALNGDAVMIDALIIEGMIPIEKEEVVLDQIDFFYLTHFSDFAVDYAEGGLDADELNMDSEENSIIDILTLNQRSSPFSWIAWSWYGNTGDNMDWDMTTMVDDATALTERGEDIVNGKGGLMGL